MIMLTRRNLLKGGAAASVLSWLQLNTTAQATSVVQAAPVPKPQEDSPEFQLLTKALRTGARIGDGAIIYVRPDDYPYAEHMLRFGYAQAHTQRNESHVQQALQMDAELVARCPEMDFPVLHGIVLFLYGHLEMRSVESLVVVENMHLPGHFNILFGQASSPDQCAESLIESLRLMIRCC